MAGLFGTTVVPSRSALLVLMFFCVFMADKMMMMISGKTRYWVSWAYLEGKGRPQSKTFCSV